MVRNGIFNYIEKTFGVTELWYNKERYAKTSTGTWVIIK